MPTPIRPDFWAAPAEAVFADLGALVVKVEAPEGDPLRRRHGAFLHFNTNKRSTVVDAASPDAGARLRLLLASADVVVQSIGEGDLETYGLSTASVRDEFPRIVVASVSGFGAEGPYAGYRWSDLVAETVAFS